MSILSSEDLKVLVTHVKSSLSLFQNGYYKINLQKGKGRLRNVKRLSKEHILRIDSNNTLKFGVPMPWGDRGHFNIQEAYLLGNEISLNRNGFFYVIIGHGVEYKPSDLMACFPFSFCLMGLEVREQKLLSL